MSNIQNDYDLAVDAQGDIVYEDNWDVAVIEGAGLVAQDVRRVLEFPVGALPWSTETGSQLQHAINAPADPTLLERELLRVARDDNRIDQESIRIEYDADGMPLLRFIVRGETDIQEVDINELS